MSTPLLLLLIIVCMSGEAFFSGMETGIISIHRMRLRHFVRQDAPGARLLEMFLESPDRLLGTTLSGTNICVVMASVLGAGLASQSLGRYGETVSTSVLTVLILIFCEYLPKAWFHARPLDRTRRFAHILRFWEIVLHPLAVSVVWVTRLLVPGSSRAFSEPAPFVTREDLQMLAREGEKDGVLSPRERSMIHRVFALSAKCAGDIMVPRDAMTTVTEDMPLVEFLAIARQSEFTRMPVCDRQQKRFTGVVNVFFVLSEAPDGEGHKVEEFARPPLVVPETMPVDDILPRMRRFRQPMCLVTNPTGDVVGLITTEDILEEIVGTL